jgi:glycosyltransferase involved in cell wall biosynthesis
MNRLDKFRIAYAFPGVGSHDSRDPSFLQQMLIAEKLKSRGHEISFIAPAGDLTELVYTNDLANSKLAVRTWSKSLPFLLTRKVAWRLQKWVHIPYLNFFSNYSYYDACLQCLPGHDIVHERNGLFKMGVAMACKKLNLPYLFFFDADDILEHDLFGKPLKGILRWRAKQTLQYNLKNADCIICVSNAAKSHLINTWKISEDKIAIFANAVDVDRFRPYPEEKEEIRKKYNNNDDIQIIFVGSFFPYQDLKVLLNAFKEILVEFPETILTLVGEGEQYFSTKQFSLEIGISQNVQFLGFQPHSDIPRLLSAADIAVAPYHKVKEDLFLGSSMKLIEYMASGVAFVASNIGQINEIVQDGENGLLVPPGDPHLLALALKNLITNAELRSRISQKARKDAVEKFSWEQYILRLERVYKALIERKPVLMI